MWKALAYFIKITIEDIIHSMFSRDKKIYAKYFWELSIREVMCLVSELIIFSFFLSGNGNLNSILAEP